MEDIGHSCLHSYLPISGLLYVLRNCTIGKSTYEVLAEICEYRLRMCLHSDIFSDVCDANVFIESWNLGSVLNTCILPNDAYDSHVTLKAEIIPTIRHFDINQHLYHGIMHFVTNLQSLPELHTFISAQMFMIWSTLLHHPKVTNSIISRLAPVYHLSFQYRL